MTHKELKAFFSQKPNIIYLFHAIEKCKEMEIGKTIGITCKINNLNVPAIIIKCEIFLKLNKYEESMKYADKILNIDTLDISSRVTIFSIKCEN